MLSVSQLIHTLQTLSRPWDDFFSPKTLALPTLPLNLQSEYYRLKINLSSFRWNYACLCLGPFALSLVLSWGMFLAGGFTAGTFTALSMVGEISKGNPIIVQGHVVTAKDRRNVGFLLMLFWLWLFGCVWKIIWMLLSCCAVCFLHAFFRASPPVSSVSQGQWKKDNSATQPVDTSGESVSEEVNVKRDERVSMTEQGVNEEVMLDEDNSNIRSRGSNVPRSFPGQVVGGAGGIRKKAE